MLKFVFLSITILAHIGYSCAQNLVPGFSTPVNCPLVLGQSNLTPPWTVALNHNGTPDYMHSCGSGIAGVPSNANGSQAAYTGSAYYGIITYGGNLREYMQVKLLSKLQKKAVYDVGFYVSLGDNYKFASNNIGIALSSTQISGSGNTLPISSVEPQVVATNIVSDKTNWTLVSATYKAKGDEEYLTIGNFSNDSVTTTTVVSGSSNFEFAYYYFDNVFIRKIRDVLYLAGDTLICKGESTSLIAKGSPVYSWAEASNPSNIIDNDSILTVSPVNTTTYLAYGLSDTISITVVVKDPPPLELGEDKNICEGSSTVLDAFYPGATYLWNDGSEESSLEVNNAGNYWVESSLNGCTVFDEINIEVVIIPEPDWEAHETVCNERKIILDLGNVQDVSFLWNNGSTSPKITVFESGIYWVKISKDDCFITRYKTIVFETSPIIDLTVDTTLCENDSLMISIPGGYNCQWSDGSKDCKKTIHEEGLYSVEVSNECGNSVSTVNVESVTCRCFTVIPNTFSPNGDGFNDHFSPLSNCTMNDFIFRIFNRSGKLVFNTQKPSIAWDGRFNLVDMPIGSYVYYLEYKYENSNEEKTAHKGSFNLLR